MTQTIVGLFDSPSDAQNAVQQLLSKGFTKEDIDISTGPGTATGSTNFDSDNIEHESGVKGFFKNLFGNDEDNADRYSKVASHVNSIVTVYAQSADEAEQAADILDEYGAVNVAEKANDYGYTAKTATGNNLLNTTGNADQSIKIIEENLNVGKKTVETGGARLRSRIVELPVEEQIRLREERIKVNRTAVNRLATEADFAAFKEGTVEMVETAEVPVVAKEARVVEEVSLGKEASERSETIRDTVRKTEVDVEQLGTTNTDTATSIENSRKNN